jgi:hypothetical protein
MGGVAKGLSDTAVVLAAAASRDLFSLLRETSSLAQDSWIRSININSSMKSPIVCN